MASAIASRFESSVGAGHVQTGSDAVQKYQIDGIAPAIAVQPADAAQAAEIVSLAIEGKMSLVPCGARTTFGVGMPPSRFDVALDLSRITGVAHYDPSDLTISVNAGMPLLELTTVLAENKQFLPLAVPYFATATVAGAIATGLDSPLRHHYGTARDFLIGAEFVDGTGALAKSGGRVVKNVTGYDFHKLLCGSLGSLAVITKLNFRTYPNPPSRRGFLASFADDSAALGFVQQIAASPLNPALIEVLSPEFAKLFLEEQSPVASLRLDTQAWTVCVGFEGGAEVCERYARDLSGLARSASAQNAVTVHDAQFMALLDILRDAPAAMRTAAPQAILFRFATLPSQLMALLRAVRSFASSSWMPNVVLIRSGTIIYLALLPKENDESAIKQVAYFWKSIGSLHGKMEFNASIVLCPWEWKRELNVWAHATADLDLQRRVKKAFDPTGTFACGRFVGGI